MTTDLDLLIDEANEDQPGTVAAVVRQAISMALDHLHDAEQGAGSGALEGATEQVEMAIEALRRYRERLERLGCEFHAMEMQLSGEEDGRFGRPWGRPDVD